jgi:hypothetical protein
MLKPGNEAEAERPDRLMPASKARFRVMLRRRAADYSLMSELTRGLHFAPSSRPAVAIGVATTLFAAVFGLRELYENSTDAASLDASSGVLPCSRALM